MSQILDFRPKKQNHNWDHQERAITLLRTGFSKYDRLIYQLPTGGGKTRIAGSLIKLANAKGNRCWFICDRISLVDQTSQSFWDQGIEHGIVQGGRKSTHQNLICSIQTLRNMKGLDTDFIIIDECHHLEKGHKDLFKRFNNIKFLGLTATPFTKGLGKYFQTKIVGATYQELIDSGILINPIHYEPSIPDLRKVGVLRGEYKQRDLDGIYDVKLVGDVLDHWFRLGGDRETLFFAANVNDSKHFTELFNKRGVPAVHIDGYNQDEQKEKIQEYKEGKYKIISCVDVLTKGFDYPEVSCIVDCSPTKSLARYLQRLGRMMRIHPGKEDGIYIDHAGNTLEHGYCTDELPENLDKGERKKGEKRKICKLIKCPKHPLDLAPYMVKGKCPQCGHEIKNYSKIIAIEAELEIKKENQKKEKKLQEMRQWASWLKWVQSAQGYKKGWAFIKFKSKYKTDPPFNIWTLNSEHPPKWFQRIYIRES